MASQPDTRTDPHVVTRRLYCIADAFHTFSIVEEVENVLRVIIRFNQLLTPPVERHWDIHRVLCHVLCSLEDYQQAEIVSDDISSVIDRRKACHAMVQSLLHRQRFDDALAVAARASF